ncbi:extracellular solute-binding protein family 1 [Phaeosphaeria sp. MPI-PUGE-AT-0046c]|nr:extracellular solute-binding protein family 1 [Phaeosphaeria sp. MPI-PUGE-AT-0046c]
MFTFSKLRLVAATFFAVTCVDALVDPTEIYTGSSSASTADVALRIATGGAGQSGLVKALSDAFIQQSVSNGSQPFSIGWILSDTTFTIKNLASGEADLGISYLPDAEKLAGDQGIIDYTNGRFYLFRDHFIIAGPPDSPAGVNSSMDATTIFAKIYQAGELNTAKTAVPTRFLTRYDKSATNLKESSLWLGIGQVPWSLPYSSWYHQYPAFPIQALTAAILLKEYTLTDRGTFLSLQQLSPDLTTSSRVERFKTGSDDETDPLLRPGHLLVGNKARNATLAKKFAEWAAGWSGQEVVRGFKKGDEQLYSAAP